MLDEKRRAEEFQKEMETALGSASPAGFTAANTNLFSSDSSGEDDLESAVACEGMSHTIERKT